jgi:Arc/MetJ-type ribon-helix-helix transcriptional regulator
MKLSVSLSEHDVALLDEHARTSGLPSRSAAVREAIRLLPRLDLEEAYAQAWDDWDTSGEREAWEGVAGDGVT